MDMPTTCGQGLAAHAPLPRKLGELIAAMAEVLEAHTRALDPHDPKNRPEHDAYRTLVAEQRDVAARLVSMAERMAGYRDLPMGRHDEETMSDARSVRAFQRWVQREEELLDHLGRDVEGHRAALRDLTPG